MGTPSVDPSPKVAAELPRCDQRVRPPDLIYGLDERPPFLHLILRLEMIVGDPNIFAIESRVTLAYDRPSQLALGFFAIHVMGRCYGVRKPDATMLADPFNEAVKRIAMRGSHNPAFR
jgi:hypothetical protein